MRKTSRKTGTRKAAAKSAAARRPTTKAVKSSARKAPAKPAPRRGQARTLEGPLVVDATNVVCGPQDRSRLDLLLSLVVAEAQDGRDVLCIFDATTPHRLQSSPERDLYRWLLQDKAHYFIQCPGRTQADALILAEAERSRGQVVSNDFFRDREEQYPWVRDSDRVMRHQPIRDVLYLGDVAIPIEPDLQTLKDQVDRLLP